MAYRVSVGGIQALCLSRYAFNAVVMICLCVTGLPLWVSMPILSDSNRQ